MPNDRSRGGPTRLLGLGLITLLVVLLTVTLGAWQTRRAEEKAARQQLLEARRAQPPVELLPTGVDAGELEWRRVRASGSYDSSRTMLVDNRTHGGRPGYHVITPLQLNGSTSFVLVNRGWLPLGRSRAELPPVPQPPREVTVEGLAIVPVERVFELKETAAEFRFGQPTVVQNLVIERFRMASSLDVLPIVIQQTDGAEADGLVREWPLPATRVQTHRTYALQWYSFAALAVVLYAVFLFRRITRRAPR